MTFILTINTNICNTIRVTKRIFHFIALICLLAQMERTAGDVIERSKLQKWNKNRTFLCSIRKKNYTSQFVPDNNTTLSLEVFGALILRESKLYFIDRRKTKVLCPGAFCRLLKFGNKVKRPLMLVDILRPDISYIKA